MKKLSVIVFAIAAVMAVIVGIMAPEAEFNFIFGTIPYLAVFIILALVALIIFFTTGNENRESKIYLNPEGKLDVQTPREYTPLKINAFSKFWGRANKFGQRNLKVFRYRDGKVYVENSKGESLEAPLSDLTFSFKKDKRKTLNGDEWYVYQYKLADKSGNKVQFNYHLYLFNEEEYDDILMLLSLSSTVKESSVSKFTQIADKVLENVEEGIPNDLGGTLHSLASLKDAVKETHQVLVNKIGVETKDRLMKKMMNEKDEDEGKGGIFGKILKFGFLALIALYVLAVIWVNIEPLFNSDDSIDITDSVELYTDESSNHEENDVLWPKSIFLEYASDEYYVCCFDVGADMFYLSIEPESGRGVYQSPRGNVFFLTIEEESYDRTEYVCSAVDENQLPSKIEFYINTEDYPNINGVMLGTDGNVRFRYTGTLAE